MKRKWGGSMFFRKSPHNKGFFVGVFDYPDSSDIPDETLIYYIAEEDENGVVKLHTTEYMQEMHEQFKGNTPDGILTMPIWRTKIFEEEEKDTQQQDGTGS